MIIVKAWDEAMYWKTNETWYRANYEADRYELTMAAPARAVDSFKLYCLRNDLPISEAIIPTENRTVVM